MAKKAKRVRSRPIEDEVIHKSNLQCCVCKMRGDHLHHLDGDPSNTVEDNLAFLCFDHHEQAERKSSLRKGLSPGVIRKYREEHYQAIQMEKERLARLMDQPIKGLTESALVNASLTALLLLEVNKVEAEYFTVPKEERADVLGRLGIYAEHSNNRIALAVMQLLSSLAHLTRSGLTEGDGTVISSIVIEFFPRGEDAQHHEQTREIAKLCIDAGNSIVYDATIHLSKLRVALPGLTILKFVHRQGVRCAMPELVEDVAKTFDWLEASMKRPERHDLDVAMEMIRFYRNELDDNNLSYPIFPPSVMRAIDGHEKDSRE